MKLKMQLNLNFFSRCDSIEKLKYKLPSLENELKDPVKFKDFYIFTFNYAKNPGQKGLDLDMAIAYWNIVLPGKFKFLDLWCQFLRVSIYNTNYESIFTTSLIFPNYL
ncbi:UNVERIFIED_CONTAM: Dcun1d1 [Trichonephila clavipes]